MAHLVLEERVTALSRDLLQRRACCWRIVNRVHMGPVCGPFSCLPGCGFCGRVVGVYRFRTKAHTRAIGSTSQGVQKS